MALTPTGACRYGEQGKENPACVDCGSLKTAHLTPADPPLSGAEGENMFFKWEINGSNI